MTKFFLSIKWQPILLRYLLESNLIDFYGLFQMFHILNQGKDETHWQRISMVPPRRVLGATAFLNGLENPQAYSWALFTQVAKWKQHHLFSANAFKYSLDLQCLSLTLYWLLICWYSMNVWMRNFCHFCTSKCIIERKPRLQWGEDDWNSCPWLESKPGPNNHQLSVPPHTKK